MMGEATEQELRGYDLSKLEKKPLGKRAKRKAHADEQLHAEAAVAVSLSLGWPHPCPCPI